MAEYNKSIGELIDYAGTENILKAISYYNKDCFLIYPSTTDLYDSSLSAHVKEKIKVDELGNYSTNKYNIEKLIKEKIKNYTIFRLPIVLNNFKDEPIVLNVKKNSIVEVTTNYDVAYALVKAIDYKDKLNKKIFNVGLGEAGRVKFDYLLKNILLNYGLSFKYIIGRVLLEKNFKCPVLLDSDELDNIIHYRHDTLQNYFNRLKRRGKNRRIAKLLAKPLVWLKNKE